MRKVLPASVKYKAVVEALSGETKLVEIAKKYNVSRQSLYFWVRDFKKSNKKTSECLKSHYRRGSVHHKSISWKLEKEILDLVVKYPDWGIATLKNKLGEVGFEISPHGIHNVLVRNELQTKELRARFSQAHPLKTVLAPAISPADRVKIVEEYLDGKQKIAKVCKAWGISRPTFYAWLRRYQEVAKVSKVPEVPNVVEALVRKYRRGEQHHRSIAQGVKEAILDIVKANPGLSVHKIYDYVKQDGRKLVGHHGIQNILSREGLSTFARRLIFAGGFIPQPRVAVAPLYRPEIPVYSWKMLLSPVKSFPKLMVTNPRAGVFRLTLTVFGLFIFRLWIMMLVSTTGASPIGLMFASVALFFGIFFFIYSTKYYISILLVLKLAQGQSRQT